MDRKRNVLVTGGTSGLGNCLVKEFVNNGWRVSTFGRRREPLLSMVSNFGRDWIFAQTCDQMEENQVRAYVSAIPESFRPFDTVILNAGIVGRTPLPLIKDTSPSDLREVMETNFFGNFYVLRNVFSYLSDNSVVIHITSNVTSETFKGWGAYAASKAAFDAIIRHLAMETSSMPRYAISVDPGEMDTEMHRKASPGDTGLISPESAARKIYTLVKERLGDHK